MKFKRNLRPAWDASVPAPFSGFFEVAGITVFLKQIKILCIQFGLYPPLCQHPGEPTAHKDYPLL